MASSVDNRIVHMTFDNKNFEKNVSDTLVTINKLDKSLEQLGSGSGVSGVSEAASKIDLSPMEKAADGVKVKFDAMSIAAMTAIGNIVNRAVDAGARIIKSLTIDPIMLGMDEFDLKQNNIQTIMAGTGEDVYTVGNALDELNHYADKTKYVFSDMTSNIGKFTNAGVGLDQSVGAIQGISNAAALAGANSNEASRSMYNFSQALSSGTVQVIDWRSIELANMATKEFREEIINSAVAMGTLSENADGTFNILTTNNKGSLSDMTLDWQNFRNTLSYNWFTDDVLIDVLNRYSDETTDLGARAFEAAQAIKTLSEFMGVLEETSQSGWAKTWELVLGNYHESVALFSGLNNVIGGWLEGLADQRNKQLEHAMERPLIQFKNTLEKSGLADGVMDKFMDRMTEFGTKAGMTGEQYNSIAEEFIATGNLTAKEAKRQLDLMLSEQITALKFQRGESKAVQDLSIKDLETYDALVLDLIRGNWGNQPERQKALENAHYDFAVVQDLVNKKVAEGKVSIEEWAASVDAATNEQLKNAGASDTQIEALRQLTGDTSELNKLIDEISSGDWSNWADYLDIITEAGLDASIAQEMMNNQLYLSEMSAEEYAATLDSLSDSQLVQMGWSMEQINVIRDLIEESEDLDTAFGQLINRMDKAGGRELLHEGIYSGLEAIQKLVEAVGRGIEKAFPTGTGEVIYNLMEGFNKFMKALVPSTKTLERVERAVANVATAFGFLAEIFKMAGSVIKGVAQPIIAVIKNVIQIFLELLGTGSDTFSGMLDGFRDFVSSPFIAQVEKISDKVTEAVNKFFGSTEEVVEKIVGVLARGVDGIKDFFSSIKIPIDDTVGWFTNLYNNISEVVKQIGDKFKELRNFFSFGKEEETEIEISGGVRTPKGVFNAPVGMTKEIVDMTLALDDLSEAQEPVFNAWTIIGAAVEKVGDAFRWAGNAIKEAWQNVKDFFAPLWDSLSEFFRSKEWRNLVTGVGTLSISSFLRDLGNFFKNIGLYTKKLPNLSVDLDKFLQGISESLTEFGKGINKNATAKVIKSVAMSILAMAGAMLILSFIDEDKLANAMGAMTLMMSMISLILLVVGEITKGSTEISRVLGKGGGLMTSTSERTGAESLLGIAGVVVAIGAAVLMMSGAVKNIASLDKTELEQATLAIGALTFFLVSTMASLEIIRFTMDKLRSPTEILNQPLLGGKSSGIGKEVKEAKKQTTVMMDLIGIAASIYILAEAVGKIGEIPEDSLDRALDAMTRLGTVITVMYAVMTLADKQGGGGSRGKGMKDMAAALLMMVAPVYILGRMDTAMLTQGIVAASALITVMGLLQTLMNISSKTTSKDMNFKDGLFSSKGSSGSDGIIKLAVALNLLVIPIAILGSMSLPTLGKGLGAMAIGLGVLVGVAVLLDKFGGSGLDKLANFFLKIAASAAIVVGSIALIVASLALFAKSLGSLVLAMIAAGAAAPLIVAGFEAVGKGIGLMIPAIVAGLIAGLGLIVNAISDFGVVFAQAIVNLVIGLVHEFAYAFDGMMEAFLMVMDTMVTYVPDLVDKFLTLIYEVLNALADHTPEIISKVMEFIADILSEIVATIDSMDPTTMKEAVEALFGIALLMKVLSMLKVNFRQAMTGLVQLVLFTAALGLAIWGIGALLGDTKVKEFITSGGDILGALSIAILKAVPLLAVATILAHALKGMGNPVILKGVTIGIVAVGIIIAALTGIVYAFGALAQTKNFNDFIDGGGEVLVKFATILGSVIAEFGAALTSTLPEIGENLEKFGESLGKFGESTSNITSASMEGVNNVVAMIMALTASNLVDSLLGFFTGGKSSMLQAAEDLIVFGEAMVKYSETISGMDMTAVEASVAVGNMFAVLQDALPTSGGVKGFLFGNQDTLGDFSEGLVSFGEAIMGFALSVSGLNLISVTNGVLAGSMLMNLYNAMPTSTEGTVLDWFLPSATPWDKFGEGLADFGKAITGFQYATEKVDPKKVSRATAAGKMLAELATTLPTDGTSVIESWFGSTMTWSQFGEGLADFGEAMTAFQVNTSDLDTGRIEIAVSAGKMLAGLADELPDDGTSVIESWFGSSMTWSEFGKGLAKFGKAMNEFQENTSDLDESKIEVAVNAGKMIAGLADKLPDDGSSIISSWFGRSMSWDDISDGLSGFGLAVNYFHKHAGSITRMTANKAEYAVGIVMSLYDNLKGFDDGTTAMDTLAQMFGVNTGTSWTDIGDGLATFGKAVSKFMKSLDKYTDEDIASVSSIVDVVEAVVDIVNYIDGEASLDTGVLADFGEDMIDFSESMVSLAGNMDGIDLTNVDTFASAVRKIKPVLAEVKALYDSGVYNESRGWGSVGLLEEAMTDIVSAYKVIREADNATSVDMSGLTDTFERAALIPPLYEQLVNDMKDNADSLATIMEGIDSLIPRLAEQSTKLVNVITNTLVNKANREKVTTAGTTMVDTLLAAFVEKKATINTDVSDNVVTPIVEAIANTDHDTKLKDAGKNIVTTITAGFVANTYEFEDGVADMMASGVEMMDGKLYITEIVANMNQIVKGMANTLTSIDNKSTIKGAADELGGDIDDGFRGRYSNIYRSGAYLVDGLVAGLESKRRALTIKANSLANTVTNTLNKAFEIKSPSRVTTRTGAFVVQGIVNAIVSGQDEARKSALGLVESITTPMNGLNSNEAHDLMAQFMGALQASMDDEVSEIKPRIRPLVDLEEFDASMGYMARSISGTTAVTANRTAGRFQRTKAEQQSLQDTINNQHSTTSNAYDVKNEFYISGTNAREIAEEVSVILGEQTKREQTVWR